MPVLVKTMRFREIEAGGKSAADAYQKKAAEKVREKRQPVGIGKNSSQQRKEQISAGILSAIDKLLANTGDKSI